MCLYVTFSARIHTYTRTRTHTPTPTHLRGFSGIGVHSTKVIETDHDKKIVSIYKIERKDEGVLGGVEERKKIDVEGSNNH